MDVRSIRQRGMTIRTINGIFRRRGSRKACHAGPAPASTARRTWTPGPRRRTVGWAAAGCPALREAVVRQVIDTVRDGGVIFSYYPDPAWLKTSKFLNCGATTVATN